MPFKQRKLQEAHQGSERKRKDIGVFAIMIGGIYVGKRHGWISEQGGFGDGFHILR